VRQSSLEVAQDLLFTGPGAQCLRSTRTRMLPAVVLSVNYIYLQLFACAARCSYAGVAHDLFSSSPAVRSSRSNVSRSNNRYIFFALHSDGSPNQQGRCLCERLLSPVADIQPGASACFTSMSAEDSGHIEALPLQPTRSFGPTIHHVTRNTKDPCCFPTLDSCATDNDSAFAALRRSHAFTAPTVTASLALLCPAM
jgi:hypothetical protein